MKIVQLLKPGLFIYECIRIMLLIFTMILLISEPGFSVKLLYAAPSALFPLMALFIWLDTRHYKVYLPLFIAGKCIGICILLGWLLTSRQITMTGGRDGIEVLAQLILSGDLFALAAILVVMKENQKPAIIQAVTEEPISEAEDI